MDFYSNSGARLPRASAAGEVAALQANVARPAQRLREESRLRQLAQAALAALYCYSLAAGTTSARFGAHIPRRGRSG